MDSVELYAGAGGLALGIGLAGFKPLAVVEWDRWACDTLRENEKRGYPLVDGWPVYEGDVREFDWDSIPRGIDLLAGGPPCQPFSMGGKHRAHGDSRDMFPATVDVVRRLEPRAFIIENVKGLTRSSFANYYQYILLQLEFPEVPSRKNESWFKHLLRLQKIRTQGSARRRMLTYNVVPTLVNAADYGIPQRRERVFIVGFRDDLGVDWSFPDATHSMDSLLFDQWVTGNYWKRHRIGPKRRPELPPRMASRVDRIANEGQRLLPWRTTRDALADLPDPRSRRARAIQDHRFQGGAKAYKGHTGSVLDLPSKTLKAGDHGVPGGENMMVLDDGTVRYFTIREAARIQTFPDGYRFHGSWTETMRQLGNAVPMMLGRLVASSVAERLLAADMRKVASQKAKGRAVA